MLAKKICHWKWQKMIRNGIKSGVMTPKTICVKWGNKSEDALITSHSNSVFIQFSLLGEVLKSVRLTSKSPEPSQPSSSSPPFEISVTGQSDTPSHLKWNLWNLVKIFCNPPSTSWHAGVIIRASKLIPWAECSIRCRWRHYFTYRPPCCCWGSCWPPYDCWRSCRSLCSCWPPCCCWWWWSCWSSCGCCTLRWSWGDKWLQGSCSLPCLGSPSHLCFDQWKSKHWNIKTSKTLKY